MDTAINFDKYQSVLNKTYFKKLGKVENVVGLTIESAGPMPNWVTYAVFIQIRKNRISYWLK